MQIAAISQQSSESSNKQGDENTASSSEWRSFDMHSVVSATEDLFLFHFIEERLEGSCFPNPGHREGF